MDFVRVGLTVLKQPTGMWESILNAFKGAMGSYIWAVILLAVLVRIVFSIVDIVNKKYSMKTAQMNNIMKPELEAIQKKYGHDQRLLQQKTSELYKKYQFNMFGSCLPMLISMVLQFVVFITLWNSLQAVANFNIAEKYENMKYVYANIISLNEENPENTILKNEINSVWENYEINADIDLNKNILTINLISSEDQGVNSFEFEMKRDWSNEEIVDMLKKYVIIPTPEEPTPQIDTTQATETEDLPVEEIVYENTGFNEIFKTLAQETAEKFYLETQEGFMWIKNVYKADSTNSPLFTKSEIKSYVSKFYSDAEKEAEKTYDYEGQIFDYVVSQGIGQKDLGANGYYILTIFAVIVSFLSMWLSNLLMKQKNQTDTKTQPKFMLFIMPIIFGIFTFMYTSLFAIYIIVGQLVMIALTPLTTLIVKKWLKADENKRKKKDDVVVVDYRRKD